MINLRPYQKEVIDIIHETFKTNKRQFVEMPTGSGKTITFLSYARKYHKKILVIVPGKELLNQIYESSLLFYHRSEISRKGNRFNEPIKNIHICIVNSIRGDYLDLLSNQEFDLIIIDEAHHTQSESYKRFLSYRSDIFKEKEGMILGVTATPERNDNKTINDILNVCSYKISIHELISQKFLSDIEGFSIKTNTDLSKIDTHNGDFSLRQLYKELSTESRNNLILELCKKEMQSRKLLIFCINVKHSKEINDLLINNGMCSQHIDGTMNANQRNLILSSFRNGEISILCNCQLLSEGFDEPSIDGIILARPTRSRSLFIQMIGRGLRIYPNKENCKIIDIVDNYKRNTNFNSIVSEDYVECDYTNFKSVKDIEKNVNEKQLEIKEFYLERQDLLNKNYFENIEPTESMIKYLKDENILYFTPISFDEASFLIWKNELKKRYENGCNRRKN